VLGYQLCLYEARGVNNQCAKGINCAYAFKFKIRNFSDNVVFLFFCFIVYNYVLRLQTIKE